MDLFGNDYPIYKCERTGLEFFVRPETSDLKTIKEVVTGNAYQKKYFNIEESEHWIDLGGNIGAFAVLAAWMGATVDVYEPDPTHCNMIAKNVEQNGFADRVTIHQKAVVVGDEKELVMYIGNNGNTWRNSVVHNWGNGKIKVPAINFKEVLNNPEICVKMDIEGAEMPIIEALDQPLKKLVFEWSFDIDTSIKRYHDACKGLEGLFQTVKYSKINSEYEHWQKSWFPACKNVFCY